MCSESVQSLTALGRVKAALDVATTAVGNIVEGDMGTIASANASIIGVREAVGALSAHFTIDEIQLQPWYPIYRGLPELNPVGANEPGQALHIQIARPRPPIKVRNVSAAEFCSWSEYSPSFRSQVLTRDPSEADVALVLRRSAHFKRILYTKGEEKALLVFDALFKLHPKISFFPELKEITILASSDHPWKLAGWLSTPFVLLSKVSKIVVRGISTPTRAAVPGREPQDLGLPHHVHLALCSILTGVAAHTGENRLRELVLDSNELTLADDGGAPYSGRIWLLRIIKAHESSLRSISLSIMPGSSIWCALAGLPNLEELRIGGVKYDRVRHHAYPTDPETSLSAFPSRRFASLRSLHFSDHGISDFTFSCLEMSTFPLLDTVQMILNQPNSIARAISSIAAGSPNLRRLIFGTDIVDGPFNGQTSQDHEVLHGTDLAPLLRLCRHLEHLEIPSQYNYRYSFEINDGTVRAMADAWRSLTFLSLAVDTSPKSTVTLEGLLPFAKNCPNLTTLRLPVDENAVLYVYASAMYRVELEGPYSKHSKRSGSSQRAPSMLRELDIGAPWVHDTATCAEFLRCIFPNLETLVAPGRHDHLSGRMYAWNKVVKLIQGEETPRSDEQVSQLRMQLDKMAVDEDDYYENADPGSSGDDADDQSEGEDWDEKRLEKALKDVGVTVCSEGTPS